MRDDIKDEIYAMYSELYIQYLTELDEIRETPDNEQIAQKHAIKETALQVFLRHPTEDKSMMWSFIYGAHVGRKSGVDILPLTISKVISADQSWKKSSGHAFEEMVKDLCTQVLAPSGIQIVLQRDASRMLAEGRIRNESPDIALITSYIQGSVFDLYAVKDGMIFGCIQAKTSVRDRVTRDREPSLGAMQHFFWSIIFVLDGAFLRLPKFMNMVRGGSDEFTQNGWHGLYTFSLTDDVNCERIYKLESDLNNFKQHAEKAYDQWINRRQWFTHEWEAE